MADLVSGGVVGALIGEVVILVKDTITTIKRFRGSLQSIKDRLSTLKPQFDKMKEHNDRMDIPNEELRPIYDVLRECKDLVKKCKTIRKLQYYEKHKCSKKLQELDDKIVDFCRVDLVAIIGGDMKELKSAVSELKDVVVEMNRMRGQVETGNIKGEKGIGGSKSKSCTVPPAPKYVVGLDVPFKNIKDKLLHGPEPVIIISAAGGYGKSTLVSQLCHDEQVKGKYKDIVFAVVSESPNLMAIVQQVINHLGGTVPETHKEDDAVRDLQKLIAERGDKNPILLVLDDIWSGSESILEKFVNKEIPTYKVLVTSRFEFPAFGCSDKLEGLKEEDAVELLRHSATPHNSESYSLPNKEIIDEVVRHCKGSPLALTVVGRSLCGKSKKVWEAKLLEWSSGTSLICNNEILKCLMFSLQDLDDERFKELQQVKSCFLDLGSFPEDHEISVAALIDMWSQLYNVDGNGVNAVANIEELSARNLADLIIKKEDISEGDGYYNDMYVKQHDLLRELAIYQNSQGPVEERERLNLNIRKNNVPKWLLDQKKPLKARLVSICTDEDFTSSWPDLELPEAEVLVLNFMATKNNYALPGFIKKMVNLKTLIITNNGPGLVELANFHLISSLTNLKKIRLEHIKIPSLTTKNDDGLCLNHLEKISAFHCDISSEIQTTDLQIHQVFPKLKEIDISYCSSLKTLPDAICKFKTLKKISISNCHKLTELPEEIRSLLGLQVLRLSNCTDLESLPSSIGDLKNLSFLDISNCVSIISLPDEFEKLEQLREFHINRCSNLSISSSTVRQLKKLEHLIVDKEQVNFRRFFRNSTKLKLKVAVEDMSLNFLGGIDG